ncbi:zinc carboxypeptidase-like [Uranotaenia lowii]|uniref:zinc carboxypeptidase-like n=1 Tax=Uranotaenia lowii TaxID=190385 RepID=UPI002478AD99|nr:zinc carboxypeptidase-like [Uranotaenia lowii]
MPVPNRLVLAIVGLILVGAFVSVALLLRTFKSVAGSGSNSVAGNKARYDHFRVIRVKLETERQVLIMQELANRSDGYEFIGYPRNLNQTLTIIMGSHKIAEMVDLMDRFKIEGTVLLNNIQELIDREQLTMKAEETPPEQFDWTHYFHLKTIYQWLDLLLSKYPFLTNISLGASYESNLIKGIKLSKKEGNTAVFVECGIHAREWIGPAVCTYLLNELLTSNVSEVRNLADNFDWFFFPVVNPDGYKYSFESDRLWRKNRKPHGLCQGVDLNRNFASNWNSSGASSDPCANNFAGDVEASELETQAIQKFLKENVGPSRIRTYFSMHSFSQLIMFPYAFTSEKVFNYEDLKAIGESGSNAILRKNGQKYISGAMSETIYPFSGDSVDWVYVECGVPVAYTFELRGPSNSTNLFVLPADEIIPTGQEILAAYIAMLNTARDLGYYSNKFR